MVQKAEFRLLCSFQADPPGSATSPPASPFVWGFPAPGARPGPDTSKSLRPSGFGAPETPQKRLFPGPALATVTAGCGTAPGGFSAGAPGPGRAQPLPPAGPTALGARPLLTLQSPQSPLLLRGEPRGSRDLDPLWGHGPGRAWAGIAPVPPEFWGEVPLGSQHGGAGAPAAPPRNTVWGFSLLSPFSPSGRKTPNSPWGRVDKTFK